MTRFSEMVNTWLGWCPNVQMFQNVQTNTTIPPAPVQNEPPGGGDARSWRSYHRRRRGMHSLIPAGLLIGLGIGLLIGHIVAAGLIGLGLGFLVSAIVNATSRMDDDTVSPDHVKTWMKEHGYNEDMSEVAAEKNGIITQAWLRPCFYRYLLYRFWYHDRLGPGSSLAVYRCSLPHTARSRDPCPRFPPPRGVLALEYFFCKKERHLFESFCGKTLVNKERFCDSNDGNKSHK